MKRKIAGIMMCMALMAAVYGCGTSTKTADVSSGTAMYVNTVANLRATPEDDGEIVQLADEHTKVTVIETTDDGWTKVKCGEDECYIKSDLLSEK